MKGALVTIAALGLVGVAALALGSREAHPTLTPAQLLVAHRGGTVQLVGFVAAAPRFDRGLVFVLTDQARAGLRQSDGRSDRNRVLLTIVTDREREGAHGDLRRPLQLD